MDIFDWLVIGIGFVAVFALAVILSPLLVPVAIAGALVRHARARLKNRRR